MRGIAVGSLLVLAACGQETVRPGKVDVPVNDPPAPTSDGSVRVALRLTGAGQGTLGALIAPIRSIAVITEDGRRLPVEQVRDEVDLARPEENSIVGFVNVPADAKKLDVTIQFDAWGAFEGPGGSGSVDLRGRPLHYVVDRDLFVGRGKAVLTVDVGRSLLRTPNGEAALLPHFDVHF